MVFRFGNSVFEPIWNRRYIEYVQITVAEELGVELRGGYTIILGSSATWSKIISFRCSP